MREINCRGLSCPEPVLLTRKAVEEDNPEGLVVIVSSETSRENVRRFAESRGFQVSSQQEGGDYRIVLTKNGISAAPNSAPGVLIVLVSTDRFGTGDDDLGRVLMKAFISTLAEAKPMPDKILFVNGGVFLSSEGSPVIDSLMSMEAQGSQILSCGTCLDFFNLKEKLAVGKVTNMFTIVESILNASNLVRI